VGCGRTLASDVADCFGAVIVKMLFVCTDQ
jgi:hypothetical protein